MAHATTTGADSASKRLVTDLDLRGSYELALEQDGQVIESILELEVERGFCGWNLRGTRQDSKEGVFDVEEGFCAQSGKLY